MSRKVSTQKRFPTKESKYNHLLISLLVNRLLKKGKKRLALKIAYRAFDVVENRLKKNPILVFEKAIRNISPRVQLKAKRMGSGIFQVPTLISRYKSTTFALQWIVATSKLRSAKGMFNKLAGEIIDASRKAGNAVKRREDIHRMAEANKAFAQPR